MFYCSTKGCIIPCSLSEPIRTSCCLCRTCVLTFNTGEFCNTTDEEGALTGTWVNDEVRLAVKKWYRILEVYEVYEYVTRYESETGEGGLFAGYIDTFLKLKEEANGYVRSQANEERYIESFWNSDGIRLDSQSRPTLLNVVWRNSASTQCG